MPFLFACVGSEESRATGEVCAVPEEGVGGEEMTADWKPIETMPRDGKEYLIATKLRSGVGKMECSKCSYLDGTKFDKWWVRTTTHNAPTEPTHWDHLPEPPK